MAPYDLFLALTPERVLAAVEAGGVECINLCYPLNSFENRVYEVELTDHSRVVAKFYRPGRWREEHILEEHRFNFHPHVHVLVTDGGFGPAGIFRPLSWFHSQNVERLFRAAVLRMLGRKSLQNRNSLFPPVGWEVGTGRSTPAHVCSLPRWRAV